jgi:hypothetical protein
MEEFVECPYFDAVDRLAKSLKRVSFGPHIGNFAERTDHNDSLGLNGINPAALKSIHVIRLL